MPQEIFNKLKKELEKSPDLKVVRLTNKKCIDVEHKEKLARCGIRIHSQNSEAPYVEIQGYYGGADENDQREFLRGYNVVAKIATLPPQQSDLPVKFKVTHACQFKDGHWKVSRKSIDVRMVKINGDNKFYVNKQEDLDKIRVACEALINVDKDCVNAQPKRSFIKIDGENEVTQEELSKYLMHNFIDAQELLRNGTMGITRPSGKRKENNKVRLWVETLYITDNRDKFPEGDISDSYWTAEWKPQNKTSNAPRHHGYWILTTNGGTNSYESITEDETFDIPLKDDNQAKTIKAGDEVLCYNTDQQMLVALSEVEEATKDKTLVLKKSTQPPKAINRDLLTQYGELDFFDKEPFTHSDKKTEPTLTPLSKEQFNLIIQIMAASKPHNRILFGAPGTGKSYTLDQDVRDLYQKDEDLMEECTERVTFHPEYSYFDFVGSYKPVMENKESSAKQDDEDKHDEERDTPQQRQIIYDFVPGPFARVLKNALEDKEDKDFVLLIEEINRAKVAAVFGDIFQLLDRNEEGESEYGINPSKELRNYLGMKEGKKLKLPANMYIWATMNSADQGVYPMDTAFKRRWSFEYAELDDGATAMQNEPYHADWEMLRKHVNALLQKEGINEDKQMGPFFLKKSELREQNAFKNAIQNKVLMYLFEDAAKHKRKKIFKEPDKGMRYSAICKIFRTIYTKSKEEGSSEYITMADILEKLFHTTK